VLLVAAWFRQRPEELARTAAIPTLAPGALSA
jgi:hypothetical protein